MGAEMQPEMVARGRDGRIELWPDEVIVYKTDGKSGETEEHRVPRAQATLIKSWGKWGLRRNDSVQAAVEKVPNQEALTLAKRLNQDRFDHEREQDLIRRYGYDPRQPVTVNVQTQGPAPVEMLTCSYCGHRSPADAGRCAHCGAPPLGGK